MNRFIRNTIFAVVGSIIIYFFMIVISSWLVVSRDFENHETESATLVFNKIEHFDLLIMGISHARNFSRHNNHKRVEDLLNKKIVNIGQGENICGPNEQLFYLDYFYQLGNSVDTILYVVSPPMMFSSTLPIASNTFNYEPFRFEFLLRYLSFESENKNQRIIQYLRSKLQRVWLLMRPYSSDRNDNKLTALDETEVKKGMKAAYPIGLDNERFKKSCSVIKKTIVLAKENDSEVVCIIPPALFGKWPGHDMVTDFLNGVEKEYNISWYDFSESVLEPEMYYDHHHLNEDGVVYFTRKYFTRIFVKDKKKNAEQNSLPRTLNH